MHPKKQNDATIKQIQDVLLVMELEKKHPQVNVDLAMDRGQERFIRLVQNVYGNKTETVPKTCATCNGNKTITTPKTCATCNGNKIITTPKTCTKCSGSGKIKTSRNCSHGYWNSHYRCSIHGNNVGQYH